MSHSLNKTGATIGRSRSIQERAAAFRTSDAGRAIWQMLNTFVPLAAGFTLMFWGVSNAWWLTALLLPVTALLFIRTFIIMHDCGHGSFTGSRRANEIIGFITGVITMTPFSQWRRDHALHHASSGDLDRRGHGDINTLTVDEYRALSRWERFKYRFYRNAFVMLVIGPLYLMIHYRRPAPSDTTRAAKASSVHYTN
ncbi:MAG: fatty acid desaturase, partial [Vicinamibacterales bacterium]